MECKFCGDCRNGIKSLRAHEVTCKLNPKRKVNHNRKGKPPWNKGLNKTNPNVAKYAMTQSLKRKGCLGKPHNDETKKKLSDIARLKGTGGQNCRKTFYHNGVALQSSYELKLAQSLDQNGVRWIRPPAFWYSDENGKQRRYYPDFYLPDYNVFLDPKNSYLVKKDETKIGAVRSQNKVKLLVLNEKQLDWKDIVGLVQLVSTDAS